MDEPNRSMKEDHRDHLSWVITTTWRRVREAGVWCFFVATVFSLSLWRLAFGIRMVLIRTAKLHRQKIKDDNISLKNVVFFFGNPIVKSLGFHHH